MCTFNVSEKGKKENFVLNRGAPNGGCRAAAPTPPKPKFKKRDFVDIVISSVLRDFPFSRNQPLKSADDQCIRILKNKLIKLKKTRRQDTVTESRNM
jgi:hypothetical protein